MQENGCCIYFKYFLNFLSHKTHTLSHVIFNNKLSLSIQNGYSTYFKYLKKIRNDAMPKILK